jgi:cation:H+ antiporter
VPAFVASLVVTLGAAALFARHLDTAGVRLGIPEALLGLLTAVAADGPEISSAVVALAKGERGVSLGVVAGSNVFNLAAMIGVSALLVGRVHLPRGALLVEGTVGAWCTLVAVALVLGVLPAGVAAVLVVLVLVPYLALLVRGHGLVEWLPLPARTVGRIRRALDEREHPPSRAGVDDRDLHRLVVEMVVAAAAIVGGSVGMVESALALASSWHVPSVLVGVLVLAPLTSLPNASTAIRLGIAHRGSALVSEAMNSNTINLIGAVVVPALLVDLGAVTTSVALDIAWLLGTTACALWLLAGRHGMRRTGGATVVVLYAAFVAAQIVYH